MCIDIAKRNIYVFGGRILQPRKIDVLTSDPVSFSGLFSYHIPTNTWTQILVDCAHETASNPEIMSIRSRVTHSMLFHHVSVSLFFQFFFRPFHIYIFAQMKFTPFHPTATSKIVYIRWSTKQRVCNRLYII